MEVNNGSITKLKFEFRARLRSLEHENVMGLMALFNEYHLRKKTIEEQLKHRALMKKQEARSE